MQDVSLLSNHAVTGIVQHCRLAINMHGCLFCCNNDYISCIVHSTSDTCYFVLTYEQFCLSGPFKLNSLVKKVNDICRLDDCINDRKQNVSYSLFCSSAVSNEGRIRKNIERKFKSKQKKKEVYNKYNDYYSKLEPAKKKQRYSLMDRTKKDELLETCAKKYKEMDASKKKNNFIKIKENNTVYCKQPLCMLV